ncbi:tyrosinase family oxidase copper chaperone [Streptomyces sp. CC77]|uniref:tyrosinase family oxidase copper chaperone n=1 Tax=Streptomyces sp. CC77 TaxID=1906739 RepID=UPI0008DE67CF|nr:tyrosinase family oxidase copper chaperone [Streptomyces sp. CC77]OII69017.1 hypothetical protein BJP39_04560 [Streptomyces sp. CC77]
MIGKSQQPPTDRRFPRLRGAVLRRGALRILFGLGAAAFSGGALARVAAAPRGGTPAPAPRRPRQRRHDGFDEMYRGRRIQGDPVAADAAECEVLVDGRPLHLMRCAGGGYVSLVDHYQAYPTPLAATRAAVDELGAARLAPVAAAHGGALRGRTHQETEGQRGAHA